MSKSEPLEALRTTENPEDIAQAVYSDDPVAHRNVAYNRNLIPAQYIELHRKISARIIRDTLLDYLTVPNHILYWNNGKFSPLANAFRRVRFRQLEYTSNPLEINAAVCGADPLAHQWVALNPLLTKDHCRHLWDHLGDIPDCRDLILHDVFPFDLLHEIALVTDNPVVRAVVLLHPNTTDEILTFAYLAGWAMI